MYWPHLRESICDWVGKGDGDGKGFYVNVPLNIVVCSLASLAMGSLVVLLEGGNCLPSLDVCWVTPLLCCEEDRSRKVSVEHC